MKDELLIWTDAMDEALLDGLIEQAKLGNRVGSTFTTTACDNICTELKKTFPQKNVTKVKFTNRLKNLKKKFTPWYDIFKQGFSGFSWDPFICKWDAEPAVWDKLIEERPAASKLRNKIFPLYYKFVEVYGRDRATGDNALTAADMRAKKSASISHIEEIDKLVNEHEIILENYETSSFENRKENTQNVVNNETPDDCTTQSSSKRAKGKAKVIADDTDGVKESIRYVGDCLLKSTAKLKNPSQCSIDESSLWTLLEEMEMGNKITHAYYFLIDNPHRLKAILGCPVEKCKDALEIFMKTS